METEKPITKYRYFIGLITGLLVATLVWKLIPMAYQGVQKYYNKSVPTPNISKQEPVAIDEVLPQKYDLGISFGDAIVKMVNSGVIDKDKFTKLYEGRTELSDEQKKLLDTPSNTPIVVTKENAGVILNLLWPLGIANQTNVLSQGPIMTRYKNDVGGLASTGGWTLGKQPGGQLFNKFSIVPLTTEQEAIVTEISQNIYRPCCGNSTYFPDCNHGAAMLGFIELAVSQEMPKEEIYKKALVLNSYWFPQTYVDLAAYFKEIKNTQWSKVDPKLVLGPNYSSNKGYLAITKELDSKGVTPEAPGGGGCGV